MKVRPGVYVVPEQVVGVVENPQPGTPDAEGQERTISILVGRNGSPIAITLKTNTENESAGIAEALGLDGSREDPIDEEPKE